MKTFATLILTLCGIANSLASSPTFGSLTVTGSIQANAGVTTGAFTLTPSGTSAVTINGVSRVIPQAVSQLTNDSGFITSTSTNTLTNKTLNLATLTGTTLAGPINSDGNPILSLSGIAIGAASLIGDIPFLVFSPEATNVQIAQILGNNGIGVAYYGTGALGTTGPVLQATQYGVTNTVDLFINPYGGRIAIGVSRAKVGGVIFDHYANGSSTSTNGDEDDLYSDELAANGLFANGDKLRAVTTVDTVSNATATRRIRQYFAGTIIFDSGALTLAAGSYFNLSTLIIRESSSIVRCVVSVTTTSASTVPYVTYTRITGLDLESDAYTLKTTGIAAGVGAASGDITARAATIEWLPAAVTP